MVKHQFGPSRADSDWRAAKAPKNFEGFIFVCSRWTIPDPERMIFGLPACHEESVRNIRRGMPLFLFNYSKRLLYGVFEAASDGGFNIDPYAWENTDFSKSGRYSNPVSKYPSQVRVRIRAEGPPLDEETFRPILDHVEGHKFRLELTAQQVQQLLHLFGAPEGELLVGRNRNNHHFPAIGSRDPESPRSAYKSDSEYYSDCSSRGLNSGEDEWTDEAVNENVNYQQGEEEGIISERLNHVALDDSLANDKGLFEMFAASEDHLAACNYNEQEMAWKGSSRKAAHCSGSDYDNPMLLRLHDNDPAVNSNSNNCMRTGVDQSLTVNRQDNVVAMPKRPSQMQFPFPRNETMIFRAVQTVQCQQRESATFRGESQRSKWSEEKKFSRGSSVNSRRQGFSQDRIHRPKDARYQKQVPSDNQQPAHMQLQNLQISQVLVPFHTLRPGQAQNQGHLAPLLSPLLMPPNGEALTYAQSQTGARLDESCQGFEVANDVQMLPEELQHFLQSGHFSLHFMASIIPRPPPCPPLITAGFVNDLHFEVLHFARLTRPSSEIQLHVEVAIDCVRNVVQTVWPEADVEVFGSFATGLCLQHSDVDLAVVDAPQIPFSKGWSIAQVSASLIRELAARLRAYEWCESINPLDTASMPVLKCLCRTPSNTSITTPLIAVDITIGGMRNSYFSWNPEACVMDIADQVPRPGKFSTRHTGGAAREYVLHKIQELPALAPLVLLLKSFLHHKDLSNVYSGGLGSFSLTLLVAFYLERLPKTREVFEDGSSSDLPTSPTTSSPLSCSSPTTSSPLFSDDSDALSSSSSSFRASNSNGASDYSGQSLGKHYVRRAADAIERVLSLLDQGGSPYLGIFLLGFLQTFGFELDLSREKIVLKGINGSPGGFFTRDDRHVALWIDDPLRPGVNIGAGSFGMVHVQTAFKEMLQVLTEGSVFTPLLQCDDKDCDDLAAISQLHHLRRLIDCGK